MTSLILFIVFSYNINNYFIIIIDGKQLFFYKLKFIQKVSKLN